MYAKQQTYAFKETCSNLYDNLDFLSVKDDADSTVSHQHFASIHKHHVNMVQFGENSKTTTSQVLNEKSSPSNECPVIQAKWCSLGSLDVLVVVNHRGLLIYDSTGQFLMYWHNPKENNKPSFSPYCRGIACAASKYICVGAPNGVIVLSYSKNTFSINETLTGHTQAITALSGVDCTANKVDFVSADDDGTICCFKSGNKFATVSCIPGSSDVCSSIKLVKEDLVISGYLSGHLRIFNAASSTILCEIAAHVRAVSCLDCANNSEEGSTVISGSEDSFVRVWKVSTNNTIEVSHEWCASIADSQVCGAKFIGKNDSTFAVTAYDSKDIIVYNKSH
uniref:WD repeat-containing protein 54-like n=1 Tax=Phallusia mammillata TaxID=59560 RepID=A0A6F9DWB3_9ASCI|nr:WD repeat-containing protein 54-like [Phallusia mammillata]